MADIQGHAPQRPVASLPLYQPQGRPTVRTKNPMRPDWMNRVRRPLQIVARSQVQFEKFVQSWRFDQSECRHVLLANDVRAMPLSIPLFALPGGWDRCTIPDFCPCETWKAKGGTVVELPASCIEKPWTFSIEELMKIETEIAIALNRHLDGLNRAP